jgi:hypothetical protein
MESRERAPDTDQATKNTAEAIAIATGTATGTATEIEIEIEIEIGIATGIAAIAKRRRKFPWDLPKRARDYSK